MGDPINPTLSVILPVRNGAATLGATLEAVRQAADAHCEILVVDDHSTDGTAETARQQGCPVVTLEEGGGAAQARTAGARAAKADVILFVDSDVWIPRDSLSRVREALARTGAGCVQGVFSTECPHTNFFSQYKNLYNCFALGELGDYIDTTYTSFTAVRKEEFFRSGGFDTGVPGASIEDRTLGRNLIRAGVRIYLDKTLKVVHNKKLTPARFFRNQFNRSRDLVKFMLRERQSRVVLAGKRFGTNSASTMVRIPAAWGLAVSGAAAFYWPPAVAAALFFAVSFIALGRNLFGFLARERGTCFAVRAVPVALLDAIVSGLGVAAGAAEYAAGKRY
ncbi:MAG: glycosyltransferase family 2 protein [Planctomycetes bacterium]|nr:glycosyltransferase family 2 protein [Planctomycetota bacterium]